MKIKMLKYPRPSQTDMLVGDKEVKPGSVIDVSEAKAEELLAAWPGCFTVDLGESKVLAKAEAKEETKQVKDYANKAATAK